MRWYKLKPLNGINFGNRYLINRNGVIKDKYTGVILKSHKRKNDGRHQIVLKSTDGKKHVCYVYRLVANNFIRKIYKDEVVNHLNTNPSDDRLENLSICTQKENINYSLNIGTMKVRGEYNGNSTKIFTTDNVHQICKYLENKNLYTYKEILEMVRIPVTKQTLDIITKIRTGKLWTHISSQYNIPQHKPRKMFSYRDYKLDIIELLKKGSSIREVADSLNIRFDNKTDYQKFWKYVSRLKDDLQRSTTIENEFNGITIDINIDDKDRW